MNSRTSTPIAQRPFVGFGKTNPLKDVSVIIPAHNEGACIAQVLVDIFNLRGKDGQFPFLEVIVVDNASSDNTAEIAARYGARVINEPTPGYGQACWAGIQASKGDVLMFVDADGAVDITQAEDLLHPIQTGADLVIGNREQIEADAMTFPQWFGNRFACQLIRLIWRMPISDLGPFRVITRRCLNTLQMQDRGFGWTVEMQVKAMQLRAQVAHVPVRWQARVAGESKISGTFRGVFFAGIGILKMISQLWWRERRNAPLPKHDSAY